MKIVKLFRKTHITQRPRSSVKAVLLNAISQLSVVLFYPAFDVGDRPHWT